MFKRILILLFVLLIAVFTTSAQQEMSADAWVRFSHLAPDAGPVNLYHDGVVYMADGYTPTVYEPGMIIPYMPIPSGTYIVAIVPDGGTLEEAYVEIETEILEEHHHNTILYGQVADESLAVLFLDESAAMLEYEMTEAVAPVILFQGISEIPAVDIYAGGELFLEEIAFGDFRIIDFPLSIVPITITVHGDPESIVLEEDFFGVPNTTALAALLGSYPDNYGRVITNFTDLSSLEFLMGAADSPIMSFNTLVTVFSTLAQSDAELPEVEGDVTFFAPTDAAFAALPEGTVDALLTDPQMLAQILFYHAVEGHLYSSDILTAMAETGSATVTSASGEDFVVTATEEGVFINDTAQLIYADIQVSDGIIHVITGVLMPPEAE